MHAITTPSSWSAQFLYALSRVGLGLAGLAEESGEEARRFSRPRY